MEFLQFLKYLLLLIFIVSISIIIFVVCLFCLFVVPYRLATMGGWKKLAASFSQIGYQKSNDVRIVKDASGRIGLENFNSCLNLTFSKMGLFMDVAFLFRFGHIRLGHKDLFIPWHEIIQIKRKKRYFSDYYEIFLKNIEDVKVLILKDDFEKGFKSDLAYDLENNMDILPSDLKDYKPRNFNYVPQGLITKR